MPKLDLSVVSKRVAKEVAESIVAAAEDALADAYREADFAVVRAERARDGARDAAKVVRAEAALYRRALERIKRDELVEGETPKSIAEAVLPAD